MTTPLRILIVDDQQSDALMIVDALRRGGFTPDWRRVDTEADFISALREHWDPLVRSAHPDSRIWGTQTHRP